MVIYNGIISGEFQYVKHEYLVRDIDRPPPASTPIAPAGSVTTGRMSQFSWSSVPTADWYFLWLNRDGSKYLTKWISGTSWTPSNEFPGGSYSWAVQTYNSAGYGPWSSSAAFSITKQLPGATVPVGPEGTLAVGTSNPPFSWQAADHANWYHVWVNRIGEGKFASRWVQVPATTWTFDMDFRGGDYRWWIAGWNPDGYGPWSSGTTFNVQQMLPDTVSLLSPTGGAVRAAGDIEYQWQPDARATWYQVWSGCPGESKSDWFSAAASVSGGVARASMTHGAWADYKWYVRGWGPDGMGNWSPAGEFVCGQPMPVGGTLSQLTWNDSYTTDAGWYHVWVNDVTGGGRTTERAWWFKHDTTTDAGSGNRSVTLAPALSAGDYEWSIRAWGPAHGTGPWSDTHTFNVP